MSGYRENSVYDRVSFAECYRFCRGWRRWGLLLLFVGMVLLGPERSYGREDGGSFYGADHAAAYQGGDGDVVDRMMIDGGVMLAQARAMTSVLVVRSNVRDAQVLVDGISVGQVNQKLKIAAGDRRVRVFHPRFYPFDQRLKVVASREYNLQANLRRKPTQQEILAAKRKREQIARQKALAVARAQAAARARAAAQALAAQQAAARAQAAQMAAIRAQEAARLRAQQETARIRAAQQAAAQRLAAEQKAARIRAAQQAAARRQAAQQAAQQEAARIRAAQQAAARARAAQSAAAYSQSYPYTARPPAYAAPPVSGYSPDATALPPTPPPAAPPALAPYGSPPPQPQRVQPPYAAAPYYAARPAPSRPKKRAKKKKKPAESKKSTAPSTSPAMPFIEPPKRDATDYIMSFLPLGLPQMRHDKPLLGTLMLLLQAGGLGGWIYAQQQADMEAENRPGVLQKYDDLKKKQSSQKDKNATQKAKAAWNRESEAWEDKMGMYAQIGMITMIAGYGFSVLEALAVGPKVKTPQDLWSYGPVRAQGAPEGMLVLSSFSFSPSLLLSPTGAAATPRLRDHGSIVRTLQRVYGDSWWELRGRGEPRGVCDVQDFLYCLTLWQEQLDLSSQGMHALIQDWEHRMSLQDPQRERGLFSSLDVTWGLLQNTLTQNVAVGASVRSSF